VDNFAILTDPNFLHAGEHVHLGYGLTAERLTNPAIDIEQLPPLDFCVLSHYHGDHFDIVSFCSQIYLLFVAGCKGMHMAQRKQAVVAGFLIGIGMGGFVDGIVLHQIFQWHNMVSNWIPPTTMEAMRVNMRWDGVFHALVWLVTLIGILMLWSAAYRREGIPPLRAFTGRIVMGWGVFNLVEGIIDHQILRIHYVRQVPEYMAYNLIFLALGGVLLVLIGWRMSKERPTSPVEP
jgi:uncharacterized membrane protein